MGWICIKILKNKNKKIVLAYEQYYLQLKKKKIKYDPLSVRLGNRLLSITVIIITDSSISVFHIFSCQVQSEVNAIHCWITSGLNISYLFLCSGILFYWQMDFAFFINDR